MLYSAGPVNNILVVRQQVSVASSRRHGSSLPPPLDKRAYEADKDADFKAVIGLQDTSSNSTDAMYVTSHVMERQIRELQVCYGFLNILKTSLPYIKTFLYSYLKKRRYF